MAHCDRSGLDAELAEPAKSMRKRLYQGLCGNPAGKHGGASTSYIAESDSSIPSIVPALPKSLKEAGKLLDACKTPSSWIQLFRAQWRSIHQAGGQVLHFQGLGTFRNTSAKVALIEVDPEPSEVNWDFLEQETAA